MHPVGDLVAEPPSVTVTDFPAPVGEPVIADLLGTRIAQQLEAKVAEGRRAGHDPTVLRRFFLGKNAYSSWERGAIGEQLVGAELHKLCRRDPRWGFLPSIPIGPDGTDLDFLVVGPGGVFTLNAKHHPGASVWVGGSTLMVNGTRYPYVRNSRHEAQNARHLLSKASGFPVDVFGLVVPVNARNFVVREQPEGVHVVNRAALNDFLLRLPPTLGEAAIHHIFNSARLSTTWIP